MEINRPTVFYITHREYAKIAEHFDHPEDAEDIKKAEITGIYYHVKGGIKVEKTNIPNQIRICLENPTQKLRKNIKKIIGNN